MKIQIDDREIIEQLDIEPGHEEDVRKRLEVIRSQMELKLQPRMLAEFRGEALYVLLTLGNDIREWNGDYLNTLLAETFAGEYLKAMDKSCEDEIVKLCQERGKGIASRMEAGQMPIFMQEKILEATKAQEAGVTNKDFMNGFIYLLSDDMTERQLCHSCEGCSKADCPSRKN